jgi:hypothetical protein
MKKIKVTYNWTIGILISLLFLSSCGNFFDESSQDEIKPSVIKDLEGVMYKEAYPYQITSPNFLIMLTDEVQCNGLLDDHYSTQHANGVPVFTFQPDMFDGTLTFPSTANAWKIYYEKIMGCNVVKDYVDNVSGTDKEKNAVLGQVLFLRAYYYLRLATIYCQAYSGANVDPDKAMGLPLQLTMTVSDNFPTRSTLKETYAQIESDLLQAATLLKDNYTADSQFRVDAVAAYALLSRLYLYMGRTEDLANVVKYADLAIENGPALTNFSSFQSQFASKGVFDIDVSPEVVWTYGSPSYKDATYFVTEMYAAQHPYTVSSSLLSLYDNVNDLRYKSFFQNRSTTTIHYTYKKGTTGLTYGDNGIRMAEVYLNRAEALIRQYKADGDNTKCTKALSDLNTLRSTRFNPQAYTDIAITNADELLDFCLKERQRELCWEEGFRWYDIKRLGLSVTHDYIDADGVSQTYTLESNSLLYALPIPYDAIDRNNKLVQNPR